MTESLSTVPDADVRAIATYIAARMAGHETGDGTPRPIDAPARAAAVAPAGAVLFAGACAGCHGSGAPMLAQGRPQLGLASSLTDPDPTSASQAVLRGIEPPVAGRGPKMPPFADSLTDAQVAEVLAYVRARYTNLPAWTGLAQRVRAARKESAQP